MASLMIPFMAFAARAAVTISSYATRRFGRFERQPVFDGLIAAAGGLYLATADGGLLCFQSATEEPSSTEGILARSRVQVDLPIH